MKTRKILQDLQLSVDNKNLLVASPKMTSQNGMVEKKSADSFKAPNLVEKENSSLVRRTRRKNEVNKVSAEITKKLTSKNSKAKNKNKSVLALKVESTTDLNQSTIESFLSPTSSLKSEELIKPGNKIFENIEEIPHTTSDSISKSIIEEISLMTSDSTSETYWQELAEQRRIALGKALHENEMLTDQIEVLKAENMQLKSALDAAEKLFQQEGLLD